MNVYLVQHAQAKSKERDPARPLTDKGRQQTLAVAALAGRLDLEVHQIRHSGKTRAQQTAEILGESISPTAGVAAAPGLGPLDDVVDMADKMDALTEPVMLVGHLPFMEKLVGQLVAGDPDRAVVRFHNAALVCLVKGDEGWQVDWIATPEVASV